MPPPWDAYHTRMYGLRLAFPDEISGVGHNSGALAKSLPISAATRAGEE